MSEESMTVVTPAVRAEPVATESRPVESPPAAMVPAAVEHDPREQLFALVGKLQRAYDRRAMVQYLRLRRAAM